MLPVQQGFYVGHNRRYRSFYRRSQKQAGCSVSVNDMRMFALTIVMGLTHLITLLPAGQPNAKMTFIFTSFLGFVASYTSITMHNKTTRKISAHISMLLAATALALFMSLYTADNFKWVLYLMVFMMVPACLGEYMKCLMVWVHERIKSRAANWPMYPFKSPTLADLEAGQI